MARRYARDNRGRFTSSGSGATARGGRLRTAAGNKRKTQTAIIRSAESRQAGKDLLKASQKSFKVNAPTRFGGENQGYATPRGKAAEQGRVTAFRNLKAAQRKSGLPASGGAMRVKGGIKRDPGVAAKLASKTKSTGAGAATRKERLAASAQRRNAQADRIDAKVKALEGQYRSKDAAFYTQGVKPAGRDRMIAKSQQAAQLREQSAALRTKAANAEKMSKQTKGTAASKRQERRDVFDAAGYKVGDTVTTRQYGTQKITKISKNTVSFDTGNAQDKAAMANYLQLQAKPQSTTTSGARLGGTRRITQATAPANTVANKTGQSKTLNKFNSRPERTRGAYVGGRYVDKSKLSGRQPLDLGRSDDRAFGRVATKAARSRAAAAKPAAKPVAKVNLSQTAFERRAKITEKRARAAEKAVAGVDRAYTTNRRAFRTADALRSAADSYASYVRRGKNNPDFTAADLFKGRARRSTAPKLSKSEKAAATRRANADKRFRENVRRMEADRRRR